MPEEKRKKKKKKPSLKEKNLQETEARRQEAEDEISDTKERQNNIARALRVLKQKSGKEAQPAGVPATDQPDEQGGPPATAGSSASTGRPAPAGDKRTPSGAGKETPRRDDGLNSRSDSPKKAYQDKNRPAGSPGQTGAGSKSSPADKSAAALSKNKIPEAQQPAAGRALRDERRGDQAENNQKSDAAPSSTEQLKGMKTRDILKQMKDLRRRAAEEGVRGVGGKIGEAAYQSAQMGTAYLLKSAWINVLHTYGLSLIYVEIHFFCHYIFSFALPPLKEIFCPMGQELLSWGKAEELGKLGKMAGSGIGGKLLEGIEVGVLILANLILLFILFGVIALIYLIVDAVEHPLKLENTWILKEGFKFMWDNFWGK